MANPTSNFGWQMPTPTDLVTDLPADFEVFGQAVDTSMADLKGGTSGQVLSKNSNTDMDFVWVTSDDANAIQNTQLTAKGALISAFSAGTPATLTVGANDLLLTAASGEATGLKYTGGWTSFSPAFFNLTLGNGTVSAKYCQIGKTVHYAGKIVFGSTTSVTGTPIGVTLPVAYNSYNTMYNAVQYLDAGVNYFVGMSSIGSGSMAFGVQNVATTYSIYAQTSSTVPFTWTTNDEIIWQVIYEVA